MNEWMNEWMNNMQIGKQEVKLCLFADDMILHTEEHTHSIKKLLELVNSGMLQNTKATHRDK